MPRSFIRSLRGRPVVMPFVVVDGVILAGGQSRRMGRDKASLLVANKTLVSYLVELMAPRVGQLIIARGEQPSLGAVAAAEDKLVVIRDFYRSSSEGPLSGLLAAMQLSGAEYLWVMTCDNYGLGGGILDALVQAVEESGADIAHARIAGRAQPLLALVSTRLAGSLEEYLESGQRSVMRWYGMQNTVVVDVVPESANFSNINTPDDYQALLESL